jgi:hypothetical protein
MSNKDKYQLIFEKQAENNKYYYFANSNVQENNDIANHLTNSNKINTISQISTLGKALMGQRIQEYWGEVKGSSLEIHLLTMEAEVGDGDTMLPIQDLKGLLEEWLIFIS